MVDFINPLNWNIIKRESYQAQVLRTRANGYDYRAIADTQVVMRSPLVLVGVKSQTAQNHWKTGCWVSQYFPFVPSSTTEFPANIRDPQSHRCELRVLNLVEFSYTGVNPYILNISFPYWLEQASIEVWQYSENMEGVYAPPHTELYRLQESLDRIEQKLESPSPSTPDEEFTVEFTNEG
jgi:hypothetical protein